MKYCINSETMGVKWIESIFTVFKGHRESLMCQSPWERERGEHIPPKMKSCQLRKRPRGHEAANANSLLKKELYLCDYLQDPAIRLHNNLQEAEQGQKKQKGACWDPGLVAWTPAVRSTDFMWRHQGLHWHCLCTLFHIMSWGPGLSRDMYHSCDQ